jgi:peptidoglycan/xylan/chitin deacetylase (PgdA/CDA1 family)
MSLGLFRKSSISEEFCAVTYHGVRPAGYQSEDPVLDGNLVSTEQLRAQLRLLQSHYRVVHPDEFRSHLRSGAPLPPRSVLLTCDDALQNVVTDMLPVLQEAGVACLFFVTGASAGEQACVLWYEELYRALMAVQAGSVSIPVVNLIAESGTVAQRRAVWWTWTRELSKYSSEVRQSAVRTVWEQAGIADDGVAPAEGPEARRFRLLTSEGVQQLARAGMSVGAHTLSHPVLAKANDSQAWTEIQQGREMLGQVVQQEVWALAYPFGEASSVGGREFAMAERAGYECAFMNCGGGARAGFPRFAIPRVHVTADMTVGEFEAHISGFHDKLRQRFGRQGAVSCA